ncbi:MAG: DUF4430 domain-containing protein [Solirubrobacteraceae bacterium]
MNRRQMIALSAAVLALAAAATPAAVASASLPKVTVRIEGKTRTLLAATTVKALSGYIRKAGAPAGVCPYSSAQGALAVATHGHWSGKWSTTYEEYFITTILGDTESGTKSYWEIFVNNVAASAGACELALHSGEQLLFAAVPATGPALDPLGIEGPTTVAVGQPFNVTVVRYNARGKAGPLAGASISVGSHTFQVNSSGVIPLKASSAGTYTLQATASGYIRDETSIVVTP